MRIVIPDDYHGLVPELRCMRDLAGHDVSVLRDAGLDAGRLAAALADAEAIIPIRERSSFPAELIRSLPALRVISQTGRSAHHIDIAACTARGIPVLAGTRASPHTVAEHTWALILSALRGIPLDAAGMKEGRWQSRFSGRLQGRTLVVLGLGTIGRLVAETGAAFGMRVLAWGRSGTAAAAKSAGYDYTDHLPSAFREADVLSVSLRLTSATRGLVTASLLSKMKPDALIVNTARAEIVERGALVAALKAGRPGYAAVDVYEDEPVLGGNHPLLGLPNALCTPHSAWVDRDTYELYFGEAVSNLLAWMEGDKVNCLNPETLKR